MLAAAFVALAAADQDAQPVGDFGEVGHFQGHRFGAAEGTGEAQGDQCPVAVAGNGRMARINSAVGLPCLALPRSTGSREAPP